MTHTFNDIPAHDLSDAMHMKLRFISAIGELIFSASHSNVEVPQTDMVYAGQLITQLTKEIEVLNTLQHNALIESKNNALITKRAA